MAGEVVVVVVDTSGPGTEVGFRIRAGPGRRGHRDGRGRADLRDAGYLSSAGVGQLGEAGAAAATRPSALVAPGYPAARILRLTGLDTVLAVTEDRPETGTSAS